MCGARTVAFLKFTEMLQKASEPMLKPAGQFGRHAGKCWAGAQTSLDMLGKCRRGLAGDVGRVLKLHGRYVGETSGVCSNFTGDMSRRRRIGAQTSLETSEKCWGIQEEYAKTC